MLNIVGRDVRGHTNSTWVQLRIPYICVNLSPAGYSGTLVLALEEARVLPAFNSVLLLKFCWHTKDIV